MIISNIIFVVPNIILITKVELKIDFNTNTFDFYAFFVFNSLLTNIVYCVGNTVTFFIYTKKFSETYFQGGYIPPPP